MGKFNEIIEREKQLIKVNTKRYNTIGNLRLIAMVVVIYTGYQAIEGSNRGIFSLGAVASIIAFALLFYKHSQIKEQLNYAKALIAINEKYLMRIQGDWVDFEDIGEEYKEDSHPYALDLDIVGEKSLFQMINTTGTWYGREALIKTLLKPGMDIQEMMSKQQVIKELGNKLELCERIEYASKKRLKVDRMPKKFLDYCMQKDKDIIKSQYKTLVRIIPLITLGIWGAAYVANNQVLFIVGIVLATTAYSPSVIYFFKFNHLLGMTRELECLLGNYAQILRELENEQFHSKKLQALKQYLFDEKNSAAKGIKHLEKISSKANLTQHPILSIPLNALWLWDCKRILELQEWQKQYGEEVEKWLEAIGEIEALMSLAVLLHIDETVHFPMFSDEKTHLQGKALAHPLLKQNLRIANDVTMDHKIFVITGSNMSGKTTFLRTLGINLVLAYSGAPVCAAHLECSKLAIYTSMRIRDDLKEGISTFYAELMRIKQIIDGAGEEEAMLFLIDEIFRGTNSIDRIEGAKSVLKSLKGKGVIGGITTHDLELCQLAEEERIENYHFTESYEEDKILFDYKLKEGPSTSTNAKYLMKMVGIEV
ncbi:MAG: DNA mismatch repair protein MutS [Cellulosilyticaceae bacterium]